MPIAGYFALTAAEYQAAPPVSPVAWMACHFSPYGTGLSNLPDVLPPGSLLMLNDRTPIQGHDPERIAAQLEAFWERQPCRGLVLDFQRPGCGESQALAAFLCRSCSVSVAVSSLYAQELDCPVFLPPVPLDVPAETWLAPWQGREIWLDLALEAQKLTPSWKPSGNGSPAGGWCWTFSAPAAARARPWRHSCAAAAPFLWQFPAYTPRSWTARCFCPRCPWMCPQKPGWPPGRVGRFGWTWRWKPKS